MPELYGAIEGGGSKFLCAIGPSPTRLGPILRVDTEDPERTLERVIAFFAPRRAELRAIGVGCFGPLELDPMLDRYGALLSTPKPGWSEFPLRARLMDALGVPVAVDTDVNAAALAEQRWGALQGADPAVYVTVGTGVGVGIVIGGRPLHGLMHPELGHLRVPAAQHRGICAFHGACVEGLISAPAVLARTGTAPEQLTDDDPIWSSVAETLAHLLSAIVLAYSPARAALGGGVLERSGLLGATQRALVSALAGYVPRAALRWPDVQRYIVRPALRPHSGLLGGLALAMDLAGG